MKVDLIKKYKCYIFKAIAVVLIMSIGLSFCAWDNNSIKNSSIKGGVSDYKPYSLVEDNDKDKMASVGDIITYGSYYQTSEAMGKDPIRWIVVHKENDELTLLAESVLAFGNFWNRYYHNGLDLTWEDTSFQQFHQNYMVSTLSMWLNSDYGTRHDQGVAFTANNAKLSMRGFMNEAFTENEIANINDRTISGIHGSETYKVWVPSWSEIFGTTATQYVVESNPTGTIVDGSPNTQFQYFEEQGVVYNESNPSLVCKTTAFASTPGKSNYTTDKDTSHISNAQSTSAGGAAWWWLRSPLHSYYPGYVLRGALAGNGGCELTYASDGGVRPAICILV